jgi:hypothetical protein
MKTKRTYYISEEAVGAVRDLASAGLARSQDAVVEMAISELARKRRDAQEAALWEQAARDPEYQAEVALLEREFATADAEIWPE